MRKWLYEKLGYELGSFIECLIYLIFMIVVGPWAVLGVCKYFKWVFG